MPDWKRVVIKVGSALIAPEGDGCRSRYLLPIARFITESLNRGREVVLVSSGAVAAGLGAVPGQGAKRYRTIPEKQALAAIGQSRMMDVWARLLDAPCAQILLTHDDLRNRKRFVNAKNTLEQLLSWGTLPIVNENDTVAVDELKVGDNDNLAAHVAVLADADLLLILSDIDGLFNANPRLDETARLIPKVSVINQAIYDLAGDSHRAIATGGMVTKIQAAEKATSRGITTVIANGSKGLTLELLLDDRCNGTIFEPVADIVNAKKHWMQHAVPTNGYIVVDEGAAKALTQNGASLLPKGILSIRGQFKHGDAVEILCRRNHKDILLAKGLTQYGSEQLAKIKGCHSDEMQAILGYAYIKVAVHRRDMVLLEEKQKHMAEEKMPLVSGGM